ncbi:MAG: hypothetical protein ABSG25_02060 [Bryobacteraceae bacterium]
MADYKIRSRPDDYDFTLGIWHPSALPSDKWNRAGFEILDSGSLRNVVEQSDAVSAMEEFRDQVEGFTADFADVDWDMFFVSEPLYHLISLSTNLVPNVAPRIVALAKDRGLVCYDPQSDTVTLPLIQPGDASI